jgi:Flp pilus assembly protein TadG
MMQETKLQGKEAGCPILSPRGSRGDRTGLIAEGARFARALRSEGGSSLVEMALVLPVLFLLLLGVVDFGRAYYLAIEVSQAAHTAALYGSQNPTDTTGMQYAAVADAPDVPNFTISSVTATYGCECSNGSLPVASCTTNPACGAMNVVDYIQVNTSTSYSAMFPYPGIPSPLTLRGSARMRAGQ